MYLLLPGDGVVGQSRCPQAQDLQAFPLGIPGLFHPHHEVVMALRTLPALASLGKARPKQSRVVTVPAGGGHFFLDRSVLGTGYLVTSFSETFSAAGAEARW